MASSATLQESAKQIERSMRTLTNDRLKEICRSQKLTVSGVKAALQQRILDHLNDAVRSGDASTINQMYQTIVPSYIQPTHSSVQQSRPLSSTSFSHNVPPAGNTGYTMSNGHARPPPSGASASRPYHNNIRFRPSPFYDILEPLMAPLVLSGECYLSSTSGKLQASAYISLSEQLTSRLRDDNSLVLMLYAAQDPSLSPYSTFVDIAFPQHLEVKINGDEIKANYKGLKGKPGSTRPVDVTRQIRHRASYKNHLLVTYAYTDKKYQFVVNLVKKHTVNELAARVRRGNVFSKEAVLREMQKKADDPDIVATSTVMSLKDPVSYTRISIPARSTVCTHNQCFDVSSYLMLQEQAPTWICPVCEKSLSFDALVLDLYVQDILNSTSSSTEQVTIEPDGKWIAGSKTENGVGDDDDSDSDDLVEISGPPSGYAQVKTEPTDRLRNLLIPGSTPPAQSREPSHTATPSSTSRANTGSKRTSEVIDLTLSDDDEPPRPSKRTAYGTPNSYAGSSKTTPIGYRPPDADAPQNNIPMRPHAYTSFQIRQPQPPSHGPSGLSSGLSASLTRNSSSSSLSRPPTYDSYGARR